jgi:hypothetical protein
MVTNHEISADKSRENDGWAGTSPGRLLLNQGGVRLEKDANYGGNYLGLV